MKLICPNDKAHKRFCVTAHVTEDWIVDEQGDFLETDCDCGLTQVIHRPDAQDYYTCAECGTEAIIK
jgi:ribosomal protein S27E